MKASARCRPSVGRKLAECYEVRRNRDDSSNPTVSSGVDRNQTMAMQTPSVLTTRATRKTTRFSVRDAKYNAAGAMHRVAWALQNSKVIGQKCENPWENQGFAAERTGTELLGVSRRFWLVREAFAVESQRAGRIVNHLSRRGRMTEVP